jgi:hypothetical protein
MIEQMTVVFAGSYRQFRQWCWQHQRSPLEPGLVYAAHVSRVRGRHGATVIRVGTYYERPDYDEMERELRWIEAAR